MPAKTVYRSRSGDNFSSVRSATLNEVFLTSGYRNSLPINNQRIAPLYNYHVFIEFMNVRRRRSGLTACPKRHLTAIYTVKKVAINSRGCLTRFSDSV